MNKAVARIVLFFFAVIAIATILILWKKQDRETALAELERVYQAKIVVHQGDVHLTVTGPKLKDLHGLADLIERAEKLEDGTPFELGVLDVTGSPNLTTFSGLERFPGLRSVIAVDCPKLESVEGVSGMASLTELILIDNPGLRDLSSIGVLPALMTLNLSECGYLETLDLRGLSQLEFLYLSGCRNLESLDVSAQGKLTQLDLDGCMKIAGIEGLGKLTRLTDLNVANCQELKHLEGVEELESLIVLDMRNVELPDFSVLGHLPRLEVLRLAGQGSLTSLAPFSGMTSLNELHVEACPNFESIRGIPESVAQYAGFIRCDKLVSLEGLEKAKNLRHLDLKHCGSLEDIGVVAGLTELIQLNLIGCKKVTSVDFLAGSRNLRFVVLGGSGVPPATIEELQKTLPETIFDYSIEE